MVPFQVMLTFLDLLPWLGGKGAAGLASRGRRLSCSLSTHPNAVHNGGCFALCSLWVPNEVIPGTKYPPAEGVIFIGSTGQAGARVLSHSARETPVSHRSGSRSGGSLSRVPQPDVGQNCPLTQVLNPCLMSRALAAF